MSRTSNFEELCNKQIANEPGLSRSAAEKKVMHTLLNAYLGIYEPLSHDPTKNLSFASYLRTNYEYGADREIVISQEFFNFANYRKAPNLTGCTLEDCMFIFNGYDSGLGISTYALKNLTGVTFKQCSFISMGLSDSFTKEGSSKVYVLKDMDFTGAKFIKTRFANFPLHQSNFTRATFDKVTFDGCSLQGNQWNGATFRNCLFNQPKPLGQAQERHDFTNATFGPGTKFTSFSIRNSNFTGARFEGVLFDHAALQANNWTNARFVQGQSFGSTFSGLFTGTVFESMSASQHTRIRGKVKPTFLVDAKEMQSAWAYAKDEKAFLKPFVQRSVNILTAVAIMGGVLTLGALLVGGWIPFIIMGIIFLSTSIGGKLGMDYYKDRQIVTFAREWKEQPAAPLRNFYLFPTLAPIVPLVPLDASFPFSRPLKNDDFDYKWFRRYVAELGEHCNKLIGLAPKFNSANFTEKEKFQASVYELYLAVKHARHYISQQSIEDREVRPDTLTLLALIKDRCALMRMGLPADPIHSVIVAGCRSKYSTSEVVSSQLKEELHKVRCHEETIAHLQAPTKANNSAATTL